MSLSSSITSWPADFRKRVVVTYYEWTINTKGRVSGVKVERIPLTKLSSWDTLSRSRVEVQDHPETFWGKMSFRRKKARQWVDWINGSK